MSVPVPVDNKELLAQIKELRDKAAAYATTAGGDSQYWKGYKLALEVVTKLIVSTTEKK